MKAARMTRFRTKTSGFLVKKEETDILLFVVYKKIKYDKLNIVFT